MLLPQHWSSAERWQGVNRKVWAAAALFDHQMWALAPPCAQRKVSTPWALQFTHEDQAQTSVMLTLDNSDFIAHAGPSSSAPGLFQWGRYSRADVVFLLCGCLRLDYQQVFPDIGTAIYGDFSVQSQLYRSENNQAQVPVQNYFTRFYLYLMTKKYRC